MINIFDRTLKIMARNHAATFLKLAFPEQPIRLTGTLQNVELSLPVRPVDFVHKVIYQGDEYLFHLEFQLKHNDELPQRTFITSAELTHQFDLPVLTVILYLQPREKDIPSSYVTQLGKTVINEFKYPVIKLWEYVDEIRQGNYRELAPLLVMLVSQPDETLLAEERTLILQEADEQKRADLLAAAVAVASRYFATDFLWLFFREELEMLKQVTFIEEWITEGVEKGLIEGRLEGRLEGRAEGRLEGRLEGRAEGLRQSREQVLQTAREAVIEVLMIRFGKVSKKLMSMINQLDELMLLKILLQKAVTSESLAEFDLYVTNLLADSD